MEILGHSGKKLAFKAFKNLAICGLFLGYNIHLIHEKLENDIPIVESIKNDYEAVSSSLSDSFVGLLKKAEGVSQKFYPDNKGYATGTVLTEKLERKNFSQDKEDKILKAYLNMPSNQKSVLIHMVYKVGSQNLRKYNNFFNSLINYLDNPTLENKEKVALQFVYHYKSNGKNLLDTRVSKIHYNEFMKDPPKEVIENNNTIEKPTKKEEAPKTLTEKEKFDKAAEDVRKDILSNFSLTNIWNYFKSNKEQYDRTHKNDPVIATSNKEDIEPIEIQYNEDESEDQLYLYNDNEEESEDIDQEYVVESSSSSSVTVTRTVIIRN